MARRYFTREEADDALERVRPLAEEMVAHGQALKPIRERRARLAEAISGNGGGIDPREVASLEAGIERELEQLARCVSEIQELGGLVKDVDQGLVDFPALRDGEEVLLCWRVGERRVEHWHGLDEGFAGRQPLDPD